MKQIFKIISQTGDQELMEKGQELEKIFDQKSLGHLNTVKAAHVVTSIKRSPAFKLKVTFSCPVIEHCI
jgi:hypothetical protein